MSERERVTLTYDELRDLEQRIYGGNTSLADMESIASDLLGYVRELLSPTGVRREVCDLKYALGAERKDAREREVAFLALRDKSTIIEGALTTKIQHLEKEILALRHEVYAFRSELDDRKHESEVNHDLEHITELNEIINDHENAIDRHRRDLREACMLLQKVLDMTTTEKEQKETILHGPFGPGYEEADRDLRTRAQAKIIAKAHT